MTKYIDTTYRIGTKNGNDITCEVEFINNRLTMKFKEDGFHEVDIYDACDTYIEDMCDSDKLQWLIDEDFCWSDRYDQLTHDRYIMPTVIESHLEFENIEYDNIGELNGEWGYYLAETVTPCVHVFFDEDFNPFYSKSVMMDIIAIFQTCVVQELPMNDYMVEYVYNTLQQLDELE